jgi:predicted permease
LRAAAGTPAVAFSFRAQAGSEAMTLTQGLIFAVIVVVVGWIILQPQRWGKRDSGNSDGGYTTVGVHGRRDHDNDNDGDGGDGGGDGGGGGGD